MREVIDLPPVWLALFAALVWLGAQPFQLGLPYGPVAGVGLIVAGLVLMGLAAGQMVLARTSFIPRRNPDALVTGGVFALCAIRSIWVMRWCLRGWRCGGTRCT